MKILLIRHGETDWNLEGRFQGREDIPLNATGIRQAELCGKVLKDESFRAVITSPLSRAKMTAEIIAEQVSVSDIIVEEDFIERDFRKLSGLTPKEREAFYASGELDDKEPFDKLCERMMNSIKKYAVCYYNENIIIVSHGASINAVLSVLSNAYTGTGKIRLKNTCINIIDYDGGKLHLGEYNLTADEYENLKRNHHRL